MRLWNSTPGDYRSRRPFGTEPAPPPSRTSSRLPAPAPGDRSGTASPPASAARCRRARTPASGRSPPPPRPSPAPPPAPAPRGRAPTPPGRRRPQGSTSEARSGSRSPDSTQRRVDASIHAAETICRPSHRPPSAIIRPSRARSRLRSSSPAAPLVAPSASFCHRQRSIPSGSKSASRAKASEAHPGPLGHHPAEDMRSAGSVGEHLSRRSFDRPRKIRRQRVLCHHPGVELRHRTLVPPQPGSHRQQIHEAQSGLLLAEALSHAGQQFPQGLVDRPDQSAIDRDPDEERHDALGRRAQVSQIVSTALEVRLGHQLVALPDDKALGALDRSRSFDQPGRGRPRDGHRRRSTPERGEATRQPRLRQPSTAILAAPCRSYALEGGRVRSLTSDHSSRSPLASLRP